MERNASATPSVLMIVALGILSALVMAFARYEQTAWELQPFANAAAKELHRTLSTFATTLGWLVFAGTLALIAVRAGKTLKG
jgi:hypothetical protein